MSQNRVMPVVPRMPSSAFASNSSRKSRGCVEALRRKSHRLPRPRSPSKVRERSNAPIEIVAIGTSTGGPAALAKVLPKLPYDFPVPIVVVQHMPPIFTRLLAERLSCHSAIRVAEGSAHALLSPGCAWIAPGNLHMKVTHAGGSWRLHLDQDHHGELLPPRGRCAVSLRGDGLWRQRPRSRDDRYGLGRFAGRAKYLRRRRRGDYPGRSFRRGLGDAGPVRAWGLDDGRLSSRSIGSRDHAPGAAELWPLHPLDWGAAFHPGASGKMTIVLSTRYGAAGPG